MKQEKEYSEKQYKKEWGILMRRTWMRFIKLLNIVLITIPFGAVWIHYYAPRMTEPFYKIENIIMILIFALVYLGIARLYHAFALHISGISELIYNQILSMLIGNAILCVLICLLLRKLLNFVPILVSMAVEAALIILWCVLAHHWYFRTHPPKKTVIVWDRYREGMEELFLRHGIDAHYDVIRSIPAEECLTTGSRSLSDAEAVFLCGVRSHDRNVITKYCLSSGIEAYVIPRIGDVIMSSAEKTHLLHLPIMLVKQCSPTPEYLFLKRFFDIFLSGLALIILSPLLLLVAVIIKLTDGGTILYRQTRLTRNGKEFQVMKFRSMRMDAEKDGVARLSAGENDPRITPVGRIIRKVRIDELPQLINILKGDMSIVGPRPERPEIASEYEKELPEFRLRLQVKAGLTGYAQVYGKYNTTPYDKLLMDLMYIAKPSLAEDIKIILATIRVLFLPESTEGIEAGKTTAAD